MSVKATLIVLFDVVYCYIIFDSPSHGLVVVVVLLFYVHGKHLRSCRDGQLT